MIEVRNVSKSFDKREVISNISLYVNKGEILCLLGPVGFKNLIFHKNAYANLQNVPILNA